MAVQILDSEFALQRILSEVDETNMPLPHIESEPHLLISKVRKHYMEYIIKLLSTNYETNQKLVNKNIYLPSAIWRCAKNIEMSAAQASMVVQLYRNNISSVVNQLKADTKKGKLNKKLFEHLNKAPENHKKTQTSSSLKDINCQCMSNKRKRRSRGSVSPKPLASGNWDSELVKFSSNSVSNDSSNCNEIPSYNIPVVLNLQTNTSSVTKNIHTNSNSATLQTQPVVNIMNSYNKTDSLKPNIRMSMESQESDELMMQLDKLFQSDPNDDDLFEGTLCDTPIYDSNKKLTNIAMETTKLNTTQELVNETYAAQIKSLDERLANLTGMLVTNDTTAAPAKTDNQKQRRSGFSKWLCEEYYMKQKFFELLDQIGESNRKGLEKIKDRLVNLFGEDSDDEGILSPLDETPDFIVSCKERIAPWVVKILTPYYIKGHIKGKSIFKALAKHLIRLIYQCSHYPEEYEVKSFVNDFLKNHKTIRCEADFKEFRIENI